MAQGKKTRVSRFEVERAARVYRTNKDASRALGIGSDAFTRRCHRYGLETPTEREKRKRGEWLSREGSAESDE